MKIGIISDIHNNLEALKVVLNKFNEFKCEMVICAGDIIGLGPNPEEVVELIINQSNFYSVKGNHDRYLQVMPDIYPNDETYITAYVYTDVCTMISFENINNTGPIDASINPHFVICFC